MNNEIKTLLKISGALFFLGFLSLFIRDSLDREELIIREITKVESIEISGKFIAVMKYKNEREEEKTLTLINNRPIIFESGIIILKIQGESDHQVKAKRIISMRSIK